MTEGKFCSKCKEFKPFSAFNGSKNKRLKLPYQPSCRLCCAAKCKEYRDRVLSTIEGRITFSLYTIKTRGATKEASVDREDLLRQWNKQNGRCALTGLPLVTEANSPKTASVDRIDSTKGYIPGNIQWVCFIVNTMKSDLPNDDFIEWAGHIADYTRSKTTLQATAA